jgi:hypothetical protein
MLRLLASGVLFSQTASGWRFAIAEGAPDGWLRVIHTPYLIGPLTGKRLHLGQIPL